MNPLRGFTETQPCRSPASEGYPEGWWHCMIHLNPETGEMHSDGDHRVRTWIQDKLANGGVDRPTMAGQEDGQ